MAGKLYLLQMNRHGAISDGFWYHYLDDRKALSELIAGNYVTNTIPNYQITLVVYRRCNFAFVARVGPPTSGLKILQGQIVWKGRFILISPVYSLVNAAADDCNRVQPTFAGAIYQNVHTNESFSQTAIGWNDLLDPSAKWTVVLPAAVGHQHDPSASHSAHRPCE